MLADHGKLLLCMRVGYLIEVICLHKKGNNYHKWLLDEMIDRKACILEMTVFSKNSHV